MRGWMIFVAAQLVVSPASGQLQSFTVPVVQGFNLISNPLDTGGNTLEEVLPVVPDGAQLYKWNARVQGYYEAADYIPGFGWWAKDAAMEGLSPGEGAFLWVNGSLEVTFRGVPHVRGVRRDTAAGYNLVSSQTTEGCSFEEVLGFGPVAGDRVYKLHQPLLAGVSNDPEAMASRVHRFSATGWDSVPWFDAGRSAFVYLAPTLRLVDEPGDQVVMAGARVEMSAHAIGQGPLFYQWYFRNEAISGQGASALALAQATLSQAGPYRVVVSDGSGSRTSRVARLQVHSGPRILEQPRSQTRILGQPATFKVSVEGTAPLTFKWFFGASGLAPSGLGASALAPSGLAPSGLGASALGASGLAPSGDTLNIAAVSTNHQGKYWVEINNAYGNAVSTTAQLTVLIPPRIISQPKSLTVEIGSTASFSVEAEGTEPLSYQWLRNGVILGGQTNRLLSIAGPQGNGVQPQDGASYRVVVANAAGAVQSDMALLRVNIPFRELADHFADAPLFREPSQIVRSSNRDASRELGEPMHAGKHGGKSVWFAWISDQDGIVTFRTRGSHVDTLLAAYVGSRVEQLTEIASDEDSAGFLASELSFNAMRNRTYFLAIDGYNGAEGDLVIEWFLEPTAERLPVIVVQPADQVARIGGDAAFMVQTEPANLPVRWFFNGRLIENVEGAVLFLRGVKPEQAGLYYAVVMQGDRTAVSRMATLQFSAVGPNDEVLNVFSRDKLGDIIDRPSGFAVNFSKNFSSMAMAGPPLHGYAGTHLFNTFGAVKEEGEPDHCGVIGGASYWFSYVPPSAGQIFLNTHGSPFDTILAVYTATGPYYSNLVEVACDNNSGPNGLTSSLDFPASAGVTYYIVVDGVSGATGLVNLNYKLLVPIVIANPAATNSFRFRITATPFLPFTIQRSPDLDTWSNALTTNAATGIFDYLDTNSALIRFYRVMQIP